MTALLLEVEHHRRQVLWGNGLSDYALANVVVLAVLAVQVATGEEDCARAITPTQDILFTVMRPVAGDIGSGSDTTGTGALRAVDCTVVAAEMAVV